MLNDGNDILLLGKPFDGSVIRTAVYDDNFKRQLDIIGADTFYRFLKQKFSLVTCDNDGNKIFFYFRAFPILSLSGSREITGQLIQ